MNAEHTLEELAALLTQESKTLPLAVEGNMPVFRPFIGSYTLNATGLPLSLKVGITPAYWLCNLVFVPVDPDPTRYIIIDQEGSGEPIRYPVWTGLTGDLTLPPFTLPGTGKRLKLEWGYNQDPYTFLYFIYAVSGVAPREIM